MFNSYLDLNSSQAKLRSKVAKARCPIKEEDCLRGIEEVCDPKDLLVMPVSDRDFELGTLYNYTTDSILGINILHLTAIHEIT